MKISNELKNKIKTAPSEPGVYVFRGTDDNILYVGKAIKLKYRLKSYVDKNVLQTYPKTARMVNEAVKVDWYLTNTELEALVLESNLIKKYKPPYNTSLKDDKAYKYIEIKKSKKISEDWDGSYRISTSRKKEGIGTYFGPFPSGTAVNVVLKDLRRLFAYRNCTETKFNRYKKLKKPCLYGHLGLCPAPCQGSLETEINNKNVDTIKKFLKGNYKKIIRDMQTRMQEYSKNMDYEKAAELRDKLNYYSYLSQKYRSSEELMRGINIHSNDIRGVHSLVSFLSFYFPKFNLNQIDNVQDYLTNFRIEFYDISNLGNTVIVGSMITLVGGEFDKKYYRKFKIKRKKEQDDFAAMSEVLERRSKHFDDWGEPNLIVIDGGKGQLSAVEKVISKYNISTIGLAKKEETIVIKDENGKYSLVNLSQTDLGLKLLIKGRNEVHRFGLSYNRSLRKIKR